jgi:hypothetical protein
VTVQPEDIDDTVAALFDEIGEEGDEVAVADGELTAEDVEGVVSYNLDWSVQSLLERIGDTFDINPAFQRRDAWTPERKSLYIESLMLGLPVPQVVLAEDPNRKGAFLVLDGKQRLVTMKQFASPDAHFRSFRLRKMQFLPQLNGLAFADVQESLTDSYYADQLLSTPVRTVVLRNWKKPAVLYQIFVRLNQNSVSLSPQELRQALFPGDFTSWINTRSANSDAIHKARRIAREDFRMRDAEMLLRSIAFLDRFEDYEGNLRKFLDEECQQGLAEWKYRQNEFETMADRIEEAIERAGLIFGEDNTFLRYENNTYIRRFNIAVYDAMTMVLSSPELSDQVILENRVHLQDAYEYLCRENREFADSLRVTTKTPRATGIRVRDYATAVEEVCGIELSVKGRALALLDARQ